MAWFLSSSLFIGTCVYYFNPDIVKLQIILTLVIVEYFDIWGFL